MQYKTIFRLLGLLLMLFSVSMLTPLLVNVAFDETFYMPFISAFICTISVGTLLWLSCRHHHRELKIRDGFLIVVLFWFVLCFFASLPFLFAIQHHNHSVTDALFESVSGFTTTGASIINHLEGLPHAVLFYRQQLQFLGGMGIVVLAVAILPMLGVGGLQLYRAETPGPMKESKLTPRIAQTAKALWSIYLLLTIACMLSYKICGMSWFNALGESFSTVSTGGFSLHDTSFSYYHSNLIELVAAIFMLLGATNFALHFIALKKHTLMHFWHNEEFRFYLLFLLISCSIVTITLLQYQVFDSSLEAIVKACFNVISFGTTTGFISAHFNTWPTFVPIFLCQLALIGGCAASTSGGVKMIRALLLFKQSKREMSRLLHPHAIYPIKFGKIVLAEPILQSMWGFISAFIALYLALMLIFMALGNDFITTFSSINAAITNAGAGLGQVSDNFTHLNVASKWVLMFAMIAGRLEIFSLLVLFSPHFWQK